MAGNYSQSSAAANPFSSHNVVGVHYRVGKKIGEGSFGIIYEGSSQCVNGGLYYMGRSNTSSCNSPKAPICLTINPWLSSLNLEKAMHPNYEMNIERTRSWLVQVSSFWDDDCLGID